MHLGLFEARLRKSSISLSGLTIKTHSPISLCIATNSPDNTMAAMNAAEPLENERSGLLYEACGLSITAIISVGFGSLMFSAPFVFQTAYPVTCLAWKSTFELSLHFHHRRGLSGGIRSMAFNQGCELHCSLCCSSKSGLLCPDPSWIEGVMLGADNAPYCPSARKRSMFNTFICSFYSMLCRTGEK